MNKELLKPIFIGGTGRSGTTILKAVLQQHSNIVTIPNELRVIIDPDGVLDLFSALTERWSVNRADVAIHRFKSLISKCLGAPYGIKMLRRLKRYKLLPLTTGGYHEILSGFGDDYVRYRTETLLNELISHQSKAEMIHTPSYRFVPTVYESGPFEKEQLSELLKHYVNDLYSHLINSKREVACWLDDTPLNIVHAAELSEIFPEMKLIHIFRDPRDVVSSYITKQWGGDNWEQVARRVAGIYRQWHLVRKRLSSEQYIELSLESLSENPKPVLQGICDHIGIEFEDRFLKINLNKANSGRWKKEIPPKVLDAVDAQLGPFLSEYSVNG